MNKAIKKILATLDPHVDELFIKAMAERQMLKELRHNSPLVFLAMETLGLSAENTLGPMLVSKVKQRVVRTRLKGFREEAEQSGIKTPIEDVIKIGNQLRLQINEETESIIASAIEEIFGDLVTDEVLEAWKADREKGK